MGKLGLTFVVVLVYNAISATSSNLYMIPSKLDAIRESEPTPPTPDTPLSKPDDFMDTFITTQSKIIDEKSSILFNIIENGRHKESNIVTTEPGQLKELILKLISDINTIRLSTLSSVDRYLASPSGLQYTPGLLKQRMIHPPSGQPRRTISKTEDR
jgi:hypothetical protein